MASKADVILPDFFRGKSLSSAGAAAQLDPATIFAFGGMAYILGLMLLQGGELCSVNLRSKSRLSCCSLPFLSRYPHTISDHQWANASWLKGELISLDFRDDE